MYSENRRECVYKKIYKKYELFPLKMCEQITMIFKKLKIQKDCFNHSLCYNLSVLLFIKKYHIISEISLNINTSNCTIGKVYLAIVR